MTDQTRRDKIIKILMMKQFGDEMIRKEIEEKEKKEKEEKEKKEKDTVPDSNPDDIDNIDNDDTETDVTETDVTETDVTETDKNKGTKVERKIYNSSYEKGRKYTRENGKGLRELFGEDKKKKVKYNINKNLINAVDADKNIISNEENKDEENKDEETNILDTHKTDSETSSEKNNMIKEDKYIKKKPRTIKRKKLFFHVKDIPMKSKMSKIRFVPNVTDKRVSESFKPYEKEKITIPTKNKSVRKIYKLNKRDEGEIKESRNNFLNNVRL